MIITIEVPDNYNKSKKFDKKDVMVCEKPGCYYHTIDITLLVRHLFEHTRKPLHNGSA